MRNYYLPFFFAALFVLFLCSGCEAYKKRICASCATKIIIKDSIWSKETVRVDTHYKSLLGPVQWLSSPCDSAGNLKLVDITVKKNGLKTTLRNIGNDLKINCDADSLQELLTLKTIENNVLHSEIKEVPVCSKRHLTDNDIFWIKVGKWLLGILIAYIILRILKAYLKSVFPIIAKFIP